MNEAQLAQVPLFAVLSTEEIQRLASTLRPVTIPSDTVLFREGEIGDRFYIVLDGAVEIIKALGTADERALGVRGAGEFVGEMSLVSMDGRRTASVRTRTESHVLEMTKQEFDELLSRQPALAYHMVRVLSTRLQQGERATICDLRAKNRELTQAYRELQAAQAQLVAKERLEHELQLARTIQESMLPQRAPQVVGFDVGMRIVPAQAVGGDFFDFVPLDRDRLGLVIGDVSGKGITAALFMALTRSLMRAEAQRSETPRIALERVNRQLRDMNAAAMFVTVLYGVLDCRTRSFAYARAGHERPLVIDATGAVTQPPLGQGHPLGIFDEPALDEQIVRLAPDDSLLLYTDGVTEAWDAQGLEFGLERLSTTIRACGDLPGQAVCDQVVATVLAYQRGVPQHDDVTLVAVRGNAVQQSTYW